MRTKPLVLLISCALAAQAALAQEKSPENGVTPTPNPADLPQGVGLPGILCTSVDSTGCPSEVPDNNPGGTTSTMDVPDCGTLFDVNVGLNVTHTWVGDLVFTLTSPGGTPVTIYDRPGVPASTFGCSGNNINVVLDDDAASPVETMCFVDPATSGTASPNNPLSAFNGESGGGTWTLLVVDAAGGDTGTLNDWSLDLECGEPTDRAQFRVTKDFTDDNPAEVEVTLSCNTGLPLEQTKSISEGEDVVFIVTDYDDGELDCTVSEAVPAGYAPAYQAVGGSVTEAGCEFDEVGFSGTHTCNITNTPIPIEIEISKEWVFEGSQDSGISAQFALFLECNAPILGNSAFYGEGNQVFTTLVQPSYLGNSCSVYEQLLDNSVEVENGCTSIPVTLGTDVSCTVTNTVFFEGIPSLNTYGLVILFLSTLGLGFIAFRRYG